MLSPIDIHNKEFKRSLWGYDVDEVNEFLDQIIKDYNALTQEKLELEQQVEELQAELERVMEGEAVPQQTSRYQTPDTSLQSMQPIDHANAAALQNMQQSIHKSIRVAQEVAEEVRLNAKKEAELIVQEAEKNADRIVNEALQKARSIHSEFLDLKQKATVYRARFRSLVQSHLDILDNSDWESLEEIEADIEARNKELEELTGEAESTEFLVDDQLQNTLPHNFQEPENNMVMDEVATSFLEEEEEPRRELRRTARKLKKKAMF